MNQLNCAYLPHFSWFVLLLLNALSALGMPTSSLHRSKELFVQTDYDQCYYALDNDTSVPQLKYGQCMSMNGPDGCCLEGHYKPGICPNLGHICCIKPDPDCSNMLNNKDITKQIIKQRREYFKTFVKNQEKDTLSRKQKRQITGEFDLGKGRPTRSTTSRQIRVNFEIVEMPAEMQLAPVAFVQAALERHKNDLNEAADHLCKMLDQKYPEPSSWACVVGYNFNYSIQPAVGKYMYFYIGNAVRRIWVMAFVPMAPEGP